MSPAPWKGRTALVTGASSGLGADFARHLAADGANVVLVARRAGPMEALARELRDRHRVAAHVVPMDLAASGAPAALLEDVKRRGLEIDVLVNNAGFGLYGEYLAIDARREREMMEIDVLVPLELTRLFGAEMVRRRRGWVLLVSSVGAYQPSPLYATYSAAKAFILSWGEALAYEWRGKGVKVSVVSPGITATSFLDVAGQKATAYQRLVVMDSTKVTRIALRALARGKPSVVPGVVNKATIFSNRLMPRAWMPPIVYRLMKST
jgi:short-subunit dehydrogenase